jgi:predicted enzyme related to lactoylglutathione lyase
MATMYRGIGKVRAHGKARIAITLEARDEQEFLERWHKPAYEYPFEWESGHKFCIEYQVEDFAAEVGFYVDVLGITVDAISPSRAQFSSPDQQLVLAVTSGEAEQQIVPPHNLRLQMFIKNLEATVAELEKRGVLFDIPIEPSSSDPELLVATLQTPNGLFIELWGYRRAISRRMSPSRPAQAPGQIDHPDEFRSSGVLDDEEEDEHSPARLPLFSSRPITIEELEDELEEDDAELTEPGITTSQQPYTIDDDQLELAIGLLDDEQEENEDEELDDEEERLEQLLRASSRPAAYTFDERVEPVASQKPEKTSPDRTVRRLDRMRRTARTKANPHLPTDLSRKQQPLRASRKPEPTPIEPTYDDIDDQDQIP